MRRFFATGMPEQKGTQSAAVQEKIKQLGKKPEELTDAEWQKVLPDEVYHVAREAGTERPHTSEFVKSMKPGKYVCFCCRTELFVSESKFYTDCGWPAFSKSVEGDKNIVRIEDNSYGMQRIEVRCRKCNAHLGHVFDDGPIKDGGERFCVNGCSLDFVPEAK
ncbi:unnamed protein product [Bursaphelenchus xylophilus]|uniref:Peptide-methionine (R)-S-oxide reductase n=1 Tax=Bursaphelenchus xylophilus TaxID=6326 RepID=A0A1I7RZK4_BURXY|nr:unnamed protein product [Bursaphelenchus xylophilus]CAG9111334.1 unnamed protein product [Bursaphelenchus xylophilus]